MDSSLDIKIEIICSFNPFLYFYIFFFNFYIFVFVINMNLWVLMVEMLVIGLVIIFDVRFI